MVLFLLLVAKAILFVHIIKIEYNVGLIILMSILYSLLFFSAVYFSKLKKKQTIAFSFYNVMSIMMFIDVLYYSHFNCLPSIIMLKQIGVVKSVGSSVLSLITPLNILFILDIPFLCFYSKKKKEKIKTENKMYDKKFRIGIPCAAGGIIIFILVFMGCRGNIGIIKNQELFTYHLNDFCSMFSQDKGVAEGEEKLTSSDLATLRDRTSVEDGKYFGIGKDKNLIVIQVESLQNFPINKKYEGKEITPNLNKLVNKENGIYFDRYYQLVGRGNTSDAEFVTQNSLYPAMEEPTYNLYADNTFYGLPWILRENGYSAWSFHGYQPEFWNREKAHPKQGFERFVNENDFKVGDIVGLGLNDEDFFDQSIPYIKEMKKPFYAFMVTLSSHNPFKMPEKYCELDLKDKHKDTLFGNYIQSIYYTDKCIGKFIDELKKEGLYEDTVICIYGDHFGVRSTDEENQKIMTDYLGYDYDFDEMMRIPLIIHLPGTDIKDTVSKVGSQLDFLPTILNIMGVHNEKGVMFGRDMLNTKEGFVAQQTYALKGSYIDNEKMFVMSRDGIYKNSRAFYLDDRKSVPLDKCRENYEKAIKEIDKSNIILKNDLMKDIIKGKGYIQCTSKSDFDIENKDFIALGGGEIDGHKLTNCKEALDESYQKGFRLIELDFEWTEDGKIVLLNDWKESMKNLFSTSSKKCTHDEFMNLKMIDGLHQMDLECLVEWMKDHSDAYIITDIKNENIQALKFIKENYPEIQDRLIPQIRYMGEYYPAISQEYKNIIFNLCFSKYTDDKIIDFVKLYKHFAVAIPEERANTKLPQKLKKQGILTYAYTIDNKKDIKKLKNNDVFGVYTENLTPNN